MVPVPRMATAPSWLPSAPLQRDQTVRFDIRGSEGQTALYVVHGVADIVSGHADNGLCGGNAFRIEAGL